MKIDAAEVRRIAELAHLHLDDAEVARMQEELTSILDYIDQLVKVDVSSLGEQPGHRGSASRDDVERSSIPRASIASNAPSFENGFFVVPRVIGE